MNQIPNANFNRKSFLRLASVFLGATITNTFLQACSWIGIISPTPDTLKNQPSKPTITIPGTVTKPPIHSPTLETPTPNTTRTSLQARTENLTKVALVKTENRLDGVRQAIELLGVNPVDGKDILLKPNFNSADPSPGSTHPDILRSMIMKLREMGAKRITVGDRSGMGNTQTVMKTLGILDLSKELGFEVLNFDELRLNEWKHFEPIESHWKQGFLMANACLECDALVQTCNLKTHRFGGIFTLSLKNSVGMIAKRHPISGYQYMSELHNSPFQCKMIAEINTTYDPALIVMDGVQAFTSGGPDRGNPASPKVILAGTDRIALDAIGVAILQIFGASFNGSIFEQEQIARAVELNLGVTSSEHIQITTIDQDGADLAEKIMEVMAKT